MNNAYELRTQFEDKITKKAARMASPATKRKALQMGSQIIKDAAKRNASVVSGNLRSSIDYKIFGDYAQIGPHVRSKAGFNYALSVEFGRRGFSPVRAKVLRFTVGGNVIFAKHVGPAKAKPFLLPALVQNRTRILTAMTLELKKGMNA